MKPSLHPITRWVLAAVGAGLVSVGAHGAAIDGKQWPSRVAADGLPRHERPAGDVVGRDMRASDVIGLAVLDRRGNTAGRIQDLVIDTRSGDIAYVFVDRGYEFFGVPDRVVAIPAARIRKAGSRGRGEAVVMDLRPGDTEYLTFEEGRWRDSNGSDRQRLASDLIDADLVTRRGRDVGHVEDVIVNLGERRVRYAVGEVDRGFLDVGDRVSIPIEGNVRTLSTRPYDAQQDERLAIVVDRQTLRRAPAPALAAAR